MWSFLLLIFYVLYFYSCISGFSLSLIYFRYRLVWDHWVFYRHHSSVITFVAILTIFVLTPLPSIWVSLDSLWASGQIDLASVFCLYDCCLFFKLVQCLLSFAIFLLSSALLLQKPFTTKLSLVLRQENKQQCENRRVLSCLGFVANVVEANFDWGRVRIVARILFHIMLL